MTEPELQVQIFRFEYIKIPDVRNLADPLVYYFDVEIFMHKLTSGGEEGEGGEGERRERGERLL